MPLTQTQVKKMDSNGFLFYPDRLHRLGTIPAMWNCCRNTWDMESACTVLVSHPIIRMVDIWAADCMSGLSQLFCVHHFIESSQWFYELFYPLLSWWEKWSPERLGNFPEITKAAAETDVKLRSLTAEPTSDHYYVILLCYVISSTHIYVMFIMRLALSWALKLQWWAENQTWFLPSWKLYSRWE